MFLGGLPYVAICCHMLPCYKTVLPAHNYAMLQLKNIEHAENREKKREKYL